MVFKSQIISTTRSGARSIRIIDVHMIYLYVRFAREAHEDKQHYRYDVVIETGPIVDMEYSHEGSHQHEEYSSRS